MSNKQLIKINIDVMKIDKDRLVDGKNGAKRLNAEVWIDTENPGKYGDHGGIYMSQTKDERDAKDKRIYIGNATDVFASKDQQSQPRQSGQRHQPANEKGWDKFDKEEGGDIPF